MRSGPEKAWSDDKPLQHKGAVGHSQRGETWETWLTVSPSSLFSEVGYFSLFLSRLLSPSIHLSPCRDKSFGPIMHPFLTGPDNMAAGETDREHNEVSVQGIYIMARRVRQV